MGIRISGLVRVAREAQRRLQAGIEPGERARFLAWVREHVEAVRRICDDHDADPAALPAPSRNALAVLTRMLDAGPEALPPPRPGAAPEPVRVRGVVGLLRDVLGRLAAAAGDDEAVRRAAAQAAQAAAEVRDFCAGEGGSPAGLSGRSGPAYGLLAWLGEAEHARRCAEAHARTLAVLERAVHARQPSAVVRLAFEPGPRVYAVRRRGRLVEVHLSIGYLAAGPEDLEDLAALALPGAGPPQPDVRRRHAAFQDGEPFHDLREEIRTAWQGAQDAPRGRAYDLDVLFDRLNARYFEGRMDRPRLTWRSSLSRVRFGSYAQGPDVVVIDDRLDDPRIPEHVAECVLYHELLHKKHGVVHEGGRRFVHTPAFRADERRHPHLEACDRWLRALAQGRVPAD